MTATWSTQDTTTRKNPRPSQTVFYYVPLSVRQFSFVQLHTDVLRVTFDTGMLLLNIILNYL